MSVGVDEQRKAFSRDAALIALAHARDQIGLPDDRSRGDRSDTGSKTSGAAEASQSVFGTSPVKPSQGVGRDRWSMWGLLGIGVLLPIGVVICAWYFLYRQADVAPASTSSVSMAAKTATPSPTLPGVAPQKDAALASVGSPRLDLNQSVVTMERQVADSLQEIQELKARQAQMLMDKSELDRRLKEAQELAHSHADLINDLKSTQAQMVQDNADLAAQVKASQEQITKLAAQLDASQTQVAKITAEIKASQDQNARLLEQKQRAKLSIPGPTRVSSPPKQLAPRPRLQRAKPQTESPADTQ